MCIDETKGNGLSIDALNTGFAQMAIEFLARCCNAVQEIDHSTRVGHDLITVFMTEYDGALEALLEERYDDLRVRLEYLDEMLFGCDDEYDISEFGDDICI